MAEQIRAEKNDSAEIELNIDPRQRIQHIPCAIIKIYSNTTL
jgi:hypothetical protein